MFARRLAVLLLAVRVVAHATVTKLGEPVLIDAAGVYVRAIRTADGALAAGYAAQSGLHHVLRVARSVDNATSWQPLGEVWRAESATHDVDNANLLQLPNGRLLFAYRNHDRTEDIPGGERRYTWYRITISHSDDGGQSWRFLSHVDERGATAEPNGLWEPFLRLASDTTLQVFYSSENNGHDQDNLMRFSRDGGMTWSNSTVVSGGGLKSRDGMTGVARLDGRGSLM
jgi:hypothetical protein